MVAKLDLNSSLSLTLRRGRGKCRWTRKRSVVNACWLRNTWKTDMNKCHRLLVVSITSARYSFVFAHFLYELGLLRLCRTYWSGDKQLITTQWCIIDPWLSAYVVWQSTSFDPNVAHTSDSGVERFFFFAREDHETPTQFTVGKSRRFAQFFFPVERDERWLHGKDIPLPLLHVPCMTWRRLKSL